MEDLDLKPDILKLETELILPEDEEEVFTGFYPEISGEDLNTIFPETNSSIHSENSVSCDVGKAVFPNRSISTTDRDVSALTKQRKVSKVQDEAISAGRRQKARRQVRSALLMMGFPVVRLEKIDLSTVNGSSVFLSTSNDKPSMVPQNKKENTEDKDSLPGLICSESPESNSQIPSSAFEGNIVNSLVASIKFEDDTEELDSVEISKKMKIAGELYHNGSEHSSRYASSTSEKISTMPLQQVFIKSEKQENNYEEVSKPNFADIDANGGLVDPLAPKASITSHFNLEPFKFPAYSETDLGTTKTDFVNDLKSCTANKNQNFCFQSWPSEQLFPPLKSELRGDFNVPQLDSDELSMRSPVTVKLKKRLPQTVKHSVKRVFSCKWCTAQFTSGYFLKKHSFSHSNEGPFTCEHCSTQFISKTLIRNHLLTKHSVGESFSCKQCTSQFMSKYLLKIHLRSHSDNKPFSCGQCPAKFILKRDYKHHVRSHVLKSTFSCKNCATQFPTKYLLKKHLLSHSNEGPFSCEHCSARFISKTLIRHHLLAKHADSKPFCCKQCGSRFKSMYLLKMHSLSHSDTKPFSCGHCPERFIMKRDLKNHLHSHLIKIYSCEHCLAQFKSKTLIRNHLLAKHGGRSFACKQCTSQFKSKSLLKVHLRSHTDTKIFSCEQCPKRFRMKRDYKHHLRSHLLKRTFYCKNCTTQFPTKYLLKKHLLSHSNERPFSCEHCSARFISKTIIRNHILAEHSDDKLYVCKQCASEFTSRYLLNKHLLSHSNVGPFSCRYCPARFISKSLVRNHISVKHSDGKLYSCKRCASKFTSVYFRKKHLLKTHSIML